ncbi:MAG: hypothetical protein DRI61_16515 [Chloroflexi bacterium]|nr:MAG: hypothetical protein DRI61_16515 [Chloroflexota bacterium]
MEDIHLPVELKKILEQGEVTIKVKKFGIIVKSKENTIKDIIGKVKLRKKVNVEKELKERLEHDIETY